MHIHIRPYNTLGIPHMQGKQWISSCLFFFRHIFFLHEYPYKTIIRPYKTILIWLKRCHKLPIWEWQKYHL